MSSPSKTSSQSPSSKSTSSDEGQSKLPSESPVEITGADNDQLSECSCSSTDGSQSDASSHASTCSDEVGPETLTEIADNWEQQSQKAFNDSFEPTSILPKDGPEAAHEHERPSPPPSPNSSRDDVSGSGSISEDSDTDDLIDDDVAAAELAYVRKRRDELLAREKSRKRGDPLTRIELEMLSDGKYLDETVGNVLTQGLVEIAKRRPSKPTEFLAAYLLADQVRIDKARKGGVPGGGEAGGETDPNCPECKTEEKAKTQNIETGSPYQETPVGGGKVSPKSRKPGELSPKSLTTPNSNKSARTSPTT